MPDKPAFVKGHVFNPQTTAYLAVVCNLHIK